MLLHEARHELGTLGEGAEIERAIVRIRALQPPGMLAR
jgi:hypothetical protein